MTNIQKIIKYLSIAFAFYLIVCIITGILSVFKVINKIYDKSSEGNNNYYKITELNNSFDTFDVKVGITNLYIKSGGSFKLETNNKHIKIKNENNKLAIKEEANINLNYDYKLTITIPENIIFNDIDIESGAGVVDIQNLSGNDVDFEFGAGKVNITKMQINNKGSIETGAGSVNIENSKFNNLDLDMGVGSLNLECFLLGNNKIDSGIGKLNIKLLDDINNYKFKISKGIGSIKYNDEELKDNMIFGNGNNVIDINGGIGNINIK